MQTGLYLKRGSPLELHMVFEDNGETRSLSVPLPEQAALELASTIFLEVGAVVGQSRLQQTAQADLSFLASIGVSQ